MEITEQIRDYVIILKLKGRLDTTNYSILEKKLLDLFNESKIQIILDCDELEYVSSSGLRVLLMFLKKAKTAGGKLIICSLQENIREIFDISGFTGIFEIFESKEEAIANI